MSKGCGRNTSVTITLLLDDGLQVTNFRLAECLLHFGRLLVQEGGKLGDDRLNAVRWLAQREKERYRYLHGAPFEGFDQDHAPPVQSVQEVLVTYVVALLQTLKFGRILRCLRFALLLSRLDHNALGHEGFLSIELRRQCQTWKLTRRNDHKQVDSGMLACMIRALLVQLPRVHKAKDRSPLAPRRQLVSE